jgi:DhnA family fructose-bisphosphate aldolase class Ia
MTATGKALRLSRILKGGARRSASFAFDHGLQGAAQDGAEDLHAGIALAVEAHVDAVILSPGALERAEELLATYTRPSVIMRLDQTTMWRLGGPMGSEEGHTRMIAGVEDAIRLGADAVICYMFTCHKDPRLEVKSVEIAAAVATQARRWGIPVVVEPMVARNGDLSPFDPEAIASNTRMAVEIGADVIKTDWSGDGRSFERVIAAAAGTPILIAGGERRGTDEDTLRTIVAILEAGAQGVLFGRAFFQSASPLRLMKAARGLIHDELTLNQAIKELSPAKGKT